MKQAVLTIFFIFIIIGLLSIVVFGSKNKKTTTILPPSSNNTNPSSPSLESSIPIFFYGNTCPHCKDVEEWMNEQSIEEKILLIKKEVYDNKANSLELAKAAEHCGLPTDNIGVPFLYAEGLCLIGVPEITTYLSEKIETATASHSGERSIR